MSGELRCHQNHPAVRQKIVICWPPLQAYMCVIQLLFFVLLRRVGAYMPIFRIYNYKLDLLNYSLFLCCQDGLGLHANFRDQNYKLSIKHCMHPSNCSKQRSLHTEPIFRLLLKVAVKGTHQCGLLNFGGISPMQI